MPCSPELARSRSLTKDVQVMHAVEGSVAACLGSWTRLRDVKTKA